MSTKGINRKMSKKRPKKAVEEEEKKGQVNHSFSNMTKPFSYNPPGTGNSQNSVSVSTHSHNTSFYSQDGGMNGERVRVAVRIRPMMKHEKNHNNIVEVESMKRVYLKTDGAPTRAFRFNAVLDERTTQDQVFENCNIGDLIDSAMEGYSATIFAYGQTGSGKTYSMAGDEKRLGVEGWKSDNTDGIIPRSVDYMWSQMTSRLEQFYVKASFAEIYKEQIQDLLNPASGILHCRWNVQNGFFVEDLTVVECTSKEDLIAVLHEGIKNRKTGSHNLNTDSSRSHSILTVYLISETKNGDDIYKKYGKISFVDLAGSERLKETESKGEMLKETGNINKSLFTLGKVIS